MDSALAQDFDSIEVIVVNDGSIDATPHIIDSYPPRIRVIHQSNRGASAARNAAVRAARGELLAFLDADDVWTPDKLAKCVMALERNPMAVLAYSDLIAVSPSAPHGKRLEAGKPFSMAEMLTNLCPLRRLRWSCGGRRLSAAEVFQSSCVRFEDSYMWFGCEM